MMFKFSTRLMAGAALLSVSAAAKSQDTQDVVIVVSSPIELSSDELVGSVSIIGENQIIQDLNGNLADTLQQTSGVSSTYFGPAAGRIVLRGLGAARVRMMMNGLGSLDVSASSPDHAVNSEVIGVKQVEILRGAAAIAYGGGAVGGIVNVIDGQIPSEPVEGDFEGYTYIGTTSVDEGLQFGTRLGMNAGPLVLQGEYVFRDANDYDIPGFAQTEAERHSDDHDDDHDDDHGDDDDDHDDEEFVYGRAEQTYYTFKTLAGAASMIQDWGYIGLSIKQTDAEYGLPGHSHDDHDDDDDDDHDDGDDHDDDHGDDDDHSDEEDAAYIDMAQTRLNVQGEINLDGFYNRIRFSAAYADYGHDEFEDGGVGTRFDMEGGETRIEISHDHGGERKGAWGLQALSRDFSALGEESFVEPVTTQDWGSFITERWDYSDWGIEAGLRYETRKLNGIRAERDYDTLSGAVSVFARPDDNSFISATLSRTERAPSDVEVFSNGPHLATGSFEIGDLNLDIETALSFEMTARYRGEAYFGEINLFHTEFDDFIGLFETGAEEDELEVFEYRQSDATHYGFEISSGVELGAFAGFDWSGSIGLDYVQGELDNGDPLPRIPPLTAHLGLNAKSENWTARLQAELASEQDEVSEHERSTQAYQLFHADVKYHLPHREGVSVFAGVRNITDEEARLHTSFLKEQLPLPGRSFRFGLKAEF